MNIELTQTEVALIIVLTESCGVLTKNKAVYDRISKSLRQQAGLE